MNYENPYFQKSGEVRNPQTPRGSVNVRNVQTVKALSRADYAITQFITEFC